QQNISIVKLLIENGADVNIRLENQRTNFLKTVVGDTALSTARLKDNNAIIEYLIEHGARE
ncbi:MAG: hypothetical protein LBK66_03990, partial [Spirochaetaceae bacterium]|nr:hypothetical protein [Spirochaetaceae bacterium]